MSQASVELDPALARVHRLVRDRDALRPGFTTAWRALSRTEPAFQRDWAIATLALVDVNAGLACIETFWRLDPADPAAAHAAADLCRHAGARAALACLLALPATRSRVGHTGVALWWQAMLRLAREAPRLVEPVSGRLGHLLAEGNAAAFLDFVAAGLKATVGDPRRRAAFFTGSDPLADALLARRPDHIGFAEAERMLNAFTAGLWSGVPRLRALPAAPPGTLARTAVASGTVMLPAAFPGVARVRAGALYRAAAAHAQAHLAVAPLRLPIGSLRPLQRVLIGLVEDARVETLAIARFPGLRGLWSAWHVASPRDGVNCIGLLARLARALLDPAYVDQDAFIAKGRRLFAAADPNDPAISRAIGGLLGNDLGQMRVQFDARSYVVDPLYRDDNTHLWDLPDTPDDAVALSVEAARATPDPDPAPRARDAGRDDQAEILATYPEWDSAARTLRPDWTTVRRATPRSGSATAVDTQLSARLSRLMRTNPLGRRRRLGPREDGDELDLDRAVAAIAALRRHQTPDVRLYRDHASAGGELATLVILDTSQSTAVRTSAGSTLLEVQQEAAAALASAVVASGGGLALYSFASAGRGDIRVTQLKSFDETLGVPVFDRLAGLRPGQSTRLGAALRHAGAEIAPRSATRKLVLVLTDGEPSDIDVLDPAELTEDARRAVLDLRQRGIDTFGINFGSVAAGAAIFGRHNTIWVSRLNDLPGRIAQIYFRLTHR